MKRGGTFKRMVEALTEDIAPGYADDDVWGDPGIGLDEPEFVGSGETYPVMPCDCGCGSPVDLTCTDPLCVCPGHMVQDGADCADCSEPIPATNAWAGYL